MKTKKMASAALFCAVTAVAAQLIIPLQPVPVSLAMVAVYLTGALLDQKTAFWAQAAYLLLGAAGAPVFSGLSGGLGKLAGPTGGYLMVYPVMALLVAWLTAKWGRGFFRYLAAMGLSLLLCYAGGTVWLAVSTGSGFGAALAAGVIPFVPFDLIKLAVTAGFACGLGNALERARLLPF